MAGTPENTPEALNPEVLPSVANLPVAQLRQVYAPLNGDIAKRLEQVRGLKAGITRRAMADELDLDAKNLFDAAEERRKRIKAPLLVAIGELDGLFKEVTVPLENTRKECTRIIAEEDEAQRQREAAEQRERERKAQAEAERIKAEEAAALAAQAEAATEPEVKEQLQQELAMVKNEPAIPTSAPAPKPAKVGTSSLRYKLKGEVIDAEAMLQWCVAHPRQIRVEFNQSDLDAALAKGVVFPITMVKVEKMAIKTQRGR
jgi:hypothetical protein